MGQLFEQLIRDFGYFGIWLVMFMENIFPPIPTDPLLPLAGILVAEGRFNFFMVWFMAVFGAMTGTVLLYLLGIWASENAIRVGVRRYGHRLSITEASLDKALDYFNQYGVWAIFFGRMLPIMRDVVSITAGMSHMPFPKFLFFSVLNSALVTGFWIFVGYKMGENWRTALGIFADNFWLTILILILLIVVVYYIRYRWKQNDTNKPLPPSV